MFKTNFVSDSDIRKVILTKGQYQVVEYERDVTVNKVTAQSEYFASQMMVRKKQVVCNLQNTGVVTQAGSMQMMLGNVNAGTNVQGLGDLLKKTISSSVTKESAIKPQYKGVGQVILEPTYQHILVEDLADWNGAVTIDDGLFLAADDSVVIKTEMRKNLSSAALGGKGLFNTSLNGKGFVVLESPVPYDELVIIELNNDVAKIDGSMAIAWSSSLSFTVEKTTKTIIGSLASGEGLVNVYKGTGKILVATLNKPT